MAVTTSLARLLKRFARDQRGTPAVMFALSAVPLLLASGAAIDYVRYSTAKTEMQSALDAAALAAAAAKTKSNSERIKIGEDTFARNMTSGMVEADGVILDIEPGNNTVLAAASYQMPATFMKLANIDTMDIDIGSEVSIPENKKAEIALVLDYSGSMNDKINGTVKYIGMKNAAKKLVSDLAAANPDKVQVGLVPFSHHVYVTLDKTFVLGASGAGTWTGCTQDRKYPFNVSDNTPTSADASKWGQPQAPAHIAEGCAPYPGKQLKVRPLDSDFAAINAQLDAMKPNAWTHIALGAEFGYHLLSPNAPFSGGADYGDETTEKIMVLLTDGMQTEPAFGPSSRTVARGESNLEKICENAKDDGIRIMTIAYNIDDGDTVDRLRECTSDPAKDFFNANNDQDVAGAFEEIKAQITAQMRISK